MIVINLRIYYPALYKQDVFFEVPEQVKLLLDELKDVYKRQPLPRSSLLFRLNADRSAASRSGVFPAVHPVVPAARLV